MSKYLKVGSYTPKLKREYYRQGWICKDEEAFLFIRIVFAMFQSFPILRIHAKTLSSYVMDRIILPLTALTLLTGKAPQLLSRNNIGIMNGAGARIANVSIEWREKYVLVRHVV